MINLEGDSPFSVPNVQHIEATAQGENVTLTIRASVPGRVELVSVYVDLSLAAADRLLSELVPAVADAAARRQARS
jgi:hypothetical protein